MASTPVKFLGIADSDGSDITGVGIKKAKYQELTTTEENYLAYQAGLRLSVDSDIAGLTLTSSGNATVGSYSNTEFDAGIGTHGVTLTTTTTTTPVYQKEGTASESGANFRKPIHYQKAGSQTQFHEMTSSEIDTLTDRLVSRIFTSDYPGSFKLGTSAPTGYSTYLHNVFEDTRTDGHSQHYSIYRRDTMSAPTAIKPLAIKRSLGGSGTYQGLQQMSTAQMQYTFGQRAKNRIMNGNNGVGTYLLLSSTSGTPTANGYTGTWHSKGVAVDTKQITAGIAYTRNFSRNRVSNYSREYVGNYLGEYTRISTRSRSSNYAGEFTRTRVSNYTRDSIITSTRNRTSTYNRTRTSNYSRDFTREPDVTRTSNYSRSFEGNYSRTFTGNYTRISVGNFITYYARIFTGDYTRNFTRDFEGNYSRNFTRIFTGNYTGDYTRQFVENVSRDSNYQRTFAGNYARNFTRTYVANYSRAFEGAYSRGYTADYQGPSFTRDFTRDSTRISTSGTSPSPFQYTQYTSGFRFGIYNSNNTTISVMFDHGDGNGSVLVRPAFGTSMTFTGARANYPTVSGQGSYTGNTYRHEYSIDTGATMYGWTYTNAYRVRLDGSGSSFTGNYTGNYTGIGSEGYLGNYTRNSVGPAGWSSYQYSLSAPAYWWRWSSDFVLPFVQTNWGGTVQNASAGSNQQYSGTPNTAANMTQFDSTDGYTYGRGAVQNSYYLKYTSEVYYQVRRKLSTSSFTGNYTRTSFRNFTRDFTRAFTGDYSRAYTRNVIYNYARIYTRDRTSNYSRTFIGNYTEDSNYTRTSILNRTSNYSRNYTRNRTSNYSRAYTRERDSSYSRNFARDFTGNYVSSSGSTYTRDRSSNYSRGFVGDFLGEYSRNYSRDFEGDYSRIFAGNYTGDYVGDYTRNFEGNYSRNFARIFAGNYTGNYTRTSLGNYSRNFNRTFVGNYQGNFTSDEIQSGTETIETYTLYVRTA